MCWSERSQPLLRHSTHTKNKFHAPDAWLEMITKQSMSARRHNLILVGMAAALALSGCSRESKEKRAFTKAGQYFEAKEFDKAEIEYINVVRLNATNGLAWARLGTIFLNKGDAGSAVSSLTKAVELQTEDLNARVQLGSIYVLANQAAKAREQAIFIMGKQPLKDEGMLLLADASRTPADVKDARQRLEKLPKEASGRAAFHLAQSKLFGREQNIKAAEASLKQALVLDPKSTQALSGLAGIAWSRGALQEAESNFAAAATNSPAKSSERLRWAEFRLRSGNVEGGRQILQDAVKTAPDFHAASLALAQVAVRQGKADEAVGLVKKVLEADPKNFEARFLDARLKLTQKKDAEALADFEKLAAQYPRAARLHFELASIYANKNEQSKADTALKAALDVEPNFSDALLLKARIDIGRGSFAPAISTLQQVLQREPSNQNASLMLAGAYRARGTPTDALPIYQALAKATPTNAGLHYLAGLTLREARREADARKAFETALKLNPDHRLSATSLIELDVREKKMAAAINRAQTLVQKYPKEAQPLFVLARVHVAASELGKAEAALQQAIALDSEFQAAYLELIRIYVQTKRYPEALAKVEIAMQKNPNDTAALLQAGLLYEKKDEFKHAAEMYERLLKIKPRNQVALNNLANLYADKLGDLDKGYERAKQGREIAPTDPFIADTLGWILYRRGDYPAALGLIQQAVAPAQGGADANSAGVLDQNPEVNYHLGAANYILGHEQPARVALQKAVDLSEDFNGIADAKRKLGVLNLDDSRLDSSQVDLLKKQLIVDPKDPVVLKRIGAYYERSGAMDQAVQNYEEALKISPSSIPLMIKLTQVYAARNQDAKAIEKAKVAYALAPNDAQVNLILGKLALRGRDFKRAVNLLLEADRQEPGQKDTALNLALAHFSLGRIADAEAALRVAQSGKGAVDTNACQRLVEIVALYKAPARLPAGEAALKLMMKAEPDSMGLKLLSGMLLEQKAAFKEARALYENLLASAPGHVPAMKRLAIISGEKLDDEKTAFDFAMKVREALPEDADIARVLGKVLFKRRDYQGSARMLREAAQAGVADADAMYALGMSHYNLKERQQSKDALQRAIGLNPDAGFVGPARQVLAELK
ncbi:MAG: tetratricopeptide repeat protein [Pedosphaera sp.]|nr:tetratricopeptide repeat protein [Pedosphaera sp.]